MTQTEVQWDRLLKIKTTGRDDTHSDQYRYPYEPTPYPVLELLSNSGYITKQNTVLDYGCGKGRVDFFLTYQTRCKAIGVEYNDRLYAMALGNQESSVSGKRTLFVQADAENFHVPTEVDRCYFFNPFSIEVFQKTFARILESYYDNPREIFLFFYYASNDYVTFLMNQPVLQYVSEISCTMFAPDENEREKIMIFKL